MLNIVLFGPPGAGKGTQSERLIESYKLEHLSTGDIFRANMKNETELGNLANSFISKGNLVPDSVTISMLAAEFEAKKGATGFIFDGFPRTTTQAEALDSLLSEHNTKISLMLSLQVPEEELIKRLLLRGKDSGRADDTDIDIITNRIKVYNEQTAVVEEFYNKQGKLVTIEGVGTIDEIFDSICRAIEAAV